MFRMKNWKNYGLKNWIEISQKYTLTIFIIVIGYTLINWTIPMTMGLRVRKYQTKLTSKKP